MHIIWKLVSIEVEIGSLVPVRYANSSRFYRFGQMQKWFILRSDHCAMDSVVPMWCMKMLWVEILNVVLSTGSTWTTLWPPATVALYAILHATCRDTISEKLWATGDEAVLFFYVNLCLGIVEVAGLYVPDLVPKGLILSQKTNPIGHADVYQICIDYVNHVYEWLL